NKGKAPYAEERYLKEGHRLYKVLNTRLEGREFIADQYSIADIAIWPWISRFEWQTIDLKRYPNVKRWYETIAARPAVQKGYKLPRDMALVPIPWVPRRKDSPRQIPQWGHFSAGLGYHANPRASRPKQAAPRPAPRLYLITPPLADPSGFTRQLTA